MQHEGNTLTQAKQRGLDQLRQLTGRQQMLGTQLEQTRQQCEGIARKQNHLQQENTALQVSLKSLLLSSLPVQPCLAILHQAKQPTCSMALECM